MKLIHPSSYKIYTENYRFEGKRIAEAVNRQTKRTTYMELIYTSDQICSLLNACHCKVDERYLVKVTKVLLQGAICHF